MSYICNLPPHLAGQLVEVVLGVVQELGDLLEPVVLLILDLTLGVRGMDHMKLKSE
jgi:hypothetical protein